MTLTAADRRVEAEGPRDVTLRLPPGFQWVPGAGWSEDDYLAGIGRRILLKCHFVDKDHWVSYPADDWDNQTAETSMYVMVEKIDSVWHPDIPDWQRGLRMDILSEELLHWSAGGRGLTSRTMSEERAFVEPWVYASLRERCSDGWDDQRVMEDARRTVMAVYDSARRDFNKIIWNVNYDRI